MNTISAVIPVFNEEKNIPLIYSKLKGVLSKIAKNHEIIFVNDGSTDDSLKLLRLLRKKDKSIKIISFSRNFGQNAARSAGLAYASGQKVIILDADLQDSPETIEKMYKMGKEGYDVVFGVKRQRDEGPIKNFLLFSFYRILNLVSQYKMPPDAGAFSLMDRRVVDALNNLPEKNKYLSGLRAWVGFKQKGVTYSRGKRSFGKSVSLTTLLKLALDALISFSYIPLRVATILGFIFAMASFIFIFVVVALRIFFGFGIIGWASTMTAILLLGSIQLITLGIIGEYLARIYDEVKKRPDYIISEKIGFGK